MCQLQRCGPETVGGFHSVKARGFFVYLCEVLAYSKSHDIRTWCQMIRSEQEMLLYSVRIQPLADKGHTWRKPRQTIRSLGSNMAISSDTAFPYKNRLRWTTTAAFNPGHHPHALFVLFVLASTLVLFSLFSSSSCLGLATRRFLAQLIIPSYIQVTNSA